MENPLEEHGRRNISSSHSSTGRSSISEGTSQVRSEHTAPGIVQNDNRNVPVPLKKRQVPTTTTILVPPEPDSGTVETSNMEGIRSNYSDVVQGIVPPNEAQQEMMDPMGMGEMDGMNNGSFGNGNGGISLNRGEAEVGEWPALPAPNTALGDDYSSDEAEYVSDSDSCGNWRGDCSTKLERYAHLFHCSHYQKLHDVKIDVGTGADRKEFTGHRLILGMKCKYFNDYFAKSKTHMGSSCITVLLPTSVKPAAFQTVLNYMYTTGELNWADMDVKGLHDVIHAAEVCKYSDLVVKCNAVMRSKLTNDTAALMYELYREKSDCKRLKEIILTQISRNVIEVFESEGFLNLSEGALCDLLNDDSWYLDEFKVFQFVRRWGEARQETETDLTLRQAMGNAFLAIRFPLLNPKDFYVIDDMKLLSSEETSELYRCFFRPNVTCVSNVFTFRSRRISSEESSRYPSSTTLDPDEVSMKPDVVDLLKIVMGDEESHHATGRTETETTCTSDETINTTISSNEHSTDVHIENQTSDEPPPKKKKRQHSATTTTEICQRHSVSTEGMQLGNLLHLINRMKDDATSENHSKTCINEVVELVQIPGPDHRVYLPNLKEFNLTFTKKRKFACGAPFKKYVKEKIPHLQNLIFFDKTPNQNSSNIFDELLKHKVNVSIYFERCLTFQVNHEDGIIVLNLINEPLAQEVLDKLGQFPLKVLAISECNVKTLDHLRRDLLNVLVIRKVKGLQNLQQFLASCNNLNVFCWNSWFSNESGLSDTLLNDLFRSNNFIEKLSVLKCKLSTPLTPREGETSVGVGFSYLRELYLDNCELSPNLVDNMQRYFPFVKRFHFYGKKSDAHLLHSVLQLRSIEWIFLWDFVYLYDKIDRKKTVKSSTIEAFLSGVFKDPRPPDKVTFILRKKIVDQDMPGTSSRALNEVQNPFDTEKWEGTKLVRDKKYTTVSELDFTQNRYDQFYKDYEMYNWCETKTERDVIRLKQKTDNEKEDVSRDKQCNSGVNEV